MDWGNSILKGSALHMVAFNVEILNDEWKYLILGTTRGLDSLAKNMLSELENPMRRHYIDGSKKPVMLGSNVNEDGDEVWEVLLLLESSCPRRCAKRGIPVHQGVLLRYNELGAHRAPELVPHMVTVGMPRPSVGIAVLSCTLAVITVIAIEEKGVPGSLRIQNWCQGAAQSSDCIAVLTCGILCSSQLCATGVLSDRP